MRETLWTQLARRARMQDPGEDFSTEPDPDRDVPPEGYEEPTS